MTTAVAEAKPVVEPEDADDHAPEAGPYTLAEHLEALGGVDPTLILWTPRPGTATEADLVACGQKLVELIDGTLVRKPMGGRETFVASTLHGFLFIWKHQTKAGLLGLPDGPYRLAEHLVRLPDISFTSWLNVPEKAAHLKPVLGFPPDLAVEVLSESDRPGAVKRKLRDYFTNGVKLVWVVDPRACTIAVYTDADTSSTLTRTDTLDGGDVLPGFTLPLAQLFDDDQLNPKPDAPPARPLAHKYGACMPPAMTLTEKVLAKAAGRDAAHPGDNIWVNVDVLMTHDVCGPGTIGVFKKHFGEHARVWDPEKVVIIPDHYIFTADAMANRNVDVLRAFVKEQNLPYYYDVGTEHYKGVCHIALPEEGHTRPGEVLLGTDSHTCTAGAFGQFATGVGNTDAGFVLGTGKTWLKVPPTMRFVFEGNLPSYLMAKDLILAVIGDIGVDGATYRAMEFDGDGVFALNIEERMTLCNMAIEAGGKNGCIAPDQVTIDYVNSRSSKSGNKPFTVMKADAGASYVHEKVYDVAKLEPVIAKPHSPDNRATVRSARGTHLDRAYIGSCTGGKMTDFRAAAGILQGRNVKIDTFVVPATTEVARGLDTETINGTTLRDIFLNAGAKIGDASCAACLGGPADTFGRLNTPISCISTTNRNFPGRMGHKEASVFLASPLTVAASALTGTIQDPRDYV